MMFSSTSGHSFLFVIFCYSRVIWFYQLNTKILFEIFASFYNFSVWLKTKIEVTYFRKYAEEAELANKLIKDWSDILQYVTKPKERFIYYQLGRGAGNSGAFNFFSFQSPAKCPALRGQIYGKIPPKWPGHLNKLSSPIP